MNKEKFLNSGLLEQYILGLTSPEENQIVEQHVQIFPEVEEELFLMKRAMDNYAAEHVVPPSPSKLSIQDSFSPYGNYQEKSSFNWPLLFAIFFAALAFYLFQGKEGNQQNITQLEAEYAALENYYDTDYKEEGVQFSMLSKIQDPRTTSIVLTPNTPNSKSFAIYHWNTATQESWLDLVQLPLLKEGNEYQVWAKVAEEVKQLGTIPNKNHQIFALPYLVDAEEIFITLGRGIENSSFPNEEGMILHCVL